MADGKLTHLGLIMDGNRRWAKANGKSTAEGHRAGYFRLKNLLKVLKDHPAIKYVSVYSFSSENWARSKEEVSGLFKLMRWVLENEIDELIAEDIRIRILGRDERLPDNLLKLMHRAETASKNGSRQLCICLNYGGQQEIADAARAAAEAGEITVDSIDDNLYAPDVPPCDLIIRTSGEMRLSNFMLWRAAYSELMFTDSLWPDFSDQELEQLIDRFNRRQRRFGA